METAIEVVSVVIVKDSVVDEVYSFHDTPKGNEEAEACFLVMCEYKLSNWEEYTSADKKAILDNGYEKFGNGSICITHSDSNY